MSNSLLVVLWLPRPTSVPDTAPAVHVLIRVLHWHRCWTEEPGHAPDNQSMEHSVEGNTLPIHPHTHVIFFTTLCFIAILYWGFLVVLSVISSFSFCIWIVWSVDSVSFKYSFLLYCNKSKRMHGTAMHLSIVDQLHILYNHRPIRMVACTKVKWHSPPFSLVSITWHPRLSRSGFETSHSCQRFGCGQLGLVRLLFAITQ